MRFYNEYALGMRGKQDAIERGSMVDHCASFFLGGGSNMLEFGQEAHVQEMNNIVVQAQLAVDIVCPSEQLGSSPKATCAIRLGVGPVC